MLCSKLLIGDAPVEIHFHIIVPIFGKNNTRRKLVKDMSIVTDIFAHLQKRFGLLVVRYKVRTRGSIWIHGFSNRMSFCYWNFGGPACLYMYLLTLIFRVHALDAIIAMISVHFNASFAYFQPPTLCLLFPHTLHEQSTHCLPVHCHFVFTMRFSVIELPNAE